MDERPAPWMDKRASAARQVKLLMIFHFVGAGLALLGLLGLLGHYATMSTLMNNPEIWRQSPNPPPAQFAELMAPFYLIMGAWMGISLLLNVLAGVFLRSRSHRIFLVIVSVTNCLYFPLGTALGIFTMVVLLTEPARHLFEPALDGPAAP